MGQCFELRSWLSLLQPLENLDMDRCRPKYDLSLSVLNELALFLSEISVCLANASSSFLLSEIAYTSILVSMEQLAFSALPECLRQESRESGSNLMGPRTHSIPRGPSLCLRLAQDVIE
jgi:hypothetical protein